MLAGIPFSLKLGGNGSGESGLVNGSGNLGLEAEDRNGNDQVDCPFSRGGVGRADGGESCQ